MRKLFGVKWFARGFLILLSRSFYGGITKLSLLFGGGISKVLTINEVSMPEL